MNILDALQLGTPAWMHDAECVGVNPDLFFPGRGDNRGMNAAKAVCRECPVRAECLDYAITERQIHGVWGGLSERERRRMRRTMRGVVA